MRTETNAERLASIKTKAKVLVVLADDVGTGEANLFTVSNDMNWLIEQVEQVPMLEAKVESLQVENGGLRELHERLEGMWLHEKRCLQEENARLREVLEFYADAKNYKTFDSSAIKDAGEIARQALAGETNGQRKA